jgi:hypothetical protein
MINIQTEVSAGELLDKISILEIKQEKINDFKKLQEIQKELFILRKTSLLLEGSDTWIKKIKEVNSRLWKIEDDIRDKERKKEFDQEFIEMARSVYFTNDQRFNIKNEINIYYKSNILEQKNHEKY